MKMKHDSQQSDETGRLFLAGLFKDQSNKQIADALAKAYDATNRKYENDILRNEQYKQGVARLRSAYGITPSDDIYVYRASTDAFVYQGSGKPTVYEGFYGKVEKMLEDIGVDVKWSGYAAYFILSGTKPPQPTFDPADTISIKDITPDGEIILRLKPGLRKDDYENTWPLLADILGEPKRLEKPMTEADRNARILALKDSGMSYKQIADMELPSVPDRTVAIDRIKKIIKRERNRLKGGDK